MFIYKIKNGLRAVMLVICSLTLAFTTHAQTLVTAPMTGTPNPGEYYNYSGITLSNTGSGFKFIAGPGSGLYLHVLSADCQPLNTAASLNQNFIKIDVPRAAGYNPTLTNYSTCQLMQTVEYFDGLGRPIQTVQVKGSPLGMDVVQPVAYDQFGREATKYLPYASTSTAGPSDGSYKADALSAQSQFYHPTNSTGTQQFSGVVNTLYPTATTIFEPSPLNRVTEQGAPGEAWQPGSGHNPNMTYSVNAANDVILWTVNTAGNGLTGGGSHYATGMLYAITTTDENGFNSVEYKDKQGRVVCKKMQLTATSPVGYTVTYYVYNDLNNLAYVIPPKPDGAAYPANIAESDTVFMNYLYGYHYDGRNRLIEKKIPGKGWEYMVYNRIDQVIFTQDAVQRGMTPQAWTYTKYDAQGRVAITGLWSSGATTGYAGETNLAAPNHVLEQWLTNWALTNPSVMWVSRDNTQPTGYSHIDPDGPVLTINYYDDYNGIPGMPANFPATNSYPTKGLPTVTKTAVINTIYNPTPDMLCTAHYYDDLGRPVKTYQQHYLAGVLSPNNYDIITNTYDFNNEVTATTRQHYKNVGGSASLGVTIANTYTFDHMGRKTQTFEKIDAGPNVLLSKVDYNEIGQVKAKYLHGATGAAPFLQDVIYKYNERGWLKRINDPVNTPTATRLFAEQLNYDSLKYSLPALRMFNGNIAEQDYFTRDGARQHVVYTYDALNRLTDGTSNAGLSEKGIKYDNLGNINQLIRGGNTGIYAYVNGSQLQSVSGITTSNYAYDFNGNATHDGRKNAAITYNMLNLPLTVTATTPAAISLTYTYDAGGNKLRKVSDTSSTDYISGIQYKTDGTIELIQTEEGRAVPITGGYEYQYTLTDHLGNNRVTFGTKTGAAVKLQVDDYFPFGLDAQSFVTSPQNKYLYNKKELQEELGQYDYGARFYDPVIARWTSVDPLVEAGQESTSPYGYVYDDPIKHTDPDGRAPTDIIVIGANNSSFTVQTSLINTTVNIAWTGIDLHGNHSVGGEHALQFGLDAVSLIDQSGVSSTASGIISAKNGDWMGAAMSVIGDIPLLGEEAKIAKVEKDIQVVEKIAVDGERVAKAEARAAKLSEVGREGQDFTKAGKDVVKELDAAKNGGKMKCSTCGVEVESAMKHEKGIRPPDNEAHVDHINKKRNGGSGTPNNGRVRCRTCNIGDQ